MGIDGAATPAGSRSPRCGLVFRFWQCDKKNHGWREGPPLTVSWQKFRSAGRAFTPPGKISFERKKNTPLRRRPSAPQSEYWPVFWRDTAK
jgi:hypothetical protein